MASKKYVCLWDFTAPANLPGISKDGIINNLALHAKMWAFQLEAGAESGYAHFQGRVSLNEKTRNPRNVLPAGVHWSPTSTANGKSFSYVLKEDTRVDGPWSNQVAEAPPPGPPRQIAFLNEENMYPWQKQIVASAKEFDSRVVDIVVDKKGCQGKSVIKTFIGFNKIGRPVPFVNDYRDIMRMIMGTPASPMYLIDIPRAIDKKHLFQLFAGIESIKDGYAYDDRYTFKEMYFDSPRVWVFTNVDPDPALLSRDRWRVWCINDAKELVLRPE